MAMEEFFVAHAAGGDWARLARQCSVELGPKGACGNLGMLYVTEPLARDLSSVVTFLRETTGVAHWVGAAAPGVCVGAVDFFDEPAMAVLTCNFAADRFHVLPTVGPDVAATLVGLAGWLGKTQPRFGIVHGDPRDRAVAPTIPALAEATSCFLVGGLTAGQKDAQVAEIAVGGGLSGVLFAQDVEVATGLTQGCSPISSSHKVTRIVDQAVAELDGRPALDVFKEDIGEVLARDLRRVAGYVHAAIPVTGSDTGDYMVRNLLGIDVETGQLTIGESLTVGDQIIFVRRDPESAKKDMARMLSQLKGRLRDGAKAAVYHSCVARGPHQFGPGAVELAMIRETIGDMPLIGFFGNGEISHNRLYGYTGVLTLFV